MELYDVLHKVDNNTYAGFFNLHEIVEDGAIDGYDIITTSPIVYVFEFTNGFGYVEQENDGKYYLQIENHGFVSNTLKAQYDLLKEYLDGNE